MFLRLPQENDSCIKKLGLKLENTFPIFLNFQISFKYTWY